MAVNWTFRLTSLVMQLFELFDVKRKGLIDFSDFVRSLNVFHPNASQEDKIDCKLAESVLFTLDGLKFMLYIHTYLIFACLLQSHLGYMIKIIQDTSSVKRYVGVLFNMLCRNSKLS